MQTNESKRKENDVIGATPKGFRDVLPEEAAERERIIQQIKDFFEFPEQYRFPLSQGGPASASSTSQN